MSNAGTGAVLANWAIDPILQGADHQLKPRDILRMEQLCHNALAAEADASDAWHLLAITLAGQGRFEDAARAAQRAASLLPSNAPYWVTRGIIASDRKRAPEAQASSREASKLNPKRWEAYYLLGRSYDRAGNFQDAIAAYRKALRGAPDIAEIHFYLARALLTADRLDEALGAFQTAFAKDREGRLDRRECFECFLRLPLKSLPAFWHAEMTGFFSREDVDKSRYAAVGLYVLMSRPAFHAPLGLAGGKSTKPDLGRIMRDPLFGLLLRGAVIGHPQFEIMLTAVRNKLLLDGELRAQAPLQFLCDLALQCFNNEFVYAESEAETAEIGGLLREIENAFLGSGAYDEQFMRSLCVLAMYRPLHGLANIEAALAGIARWGEAELLLHKAIAGPREERRLRTTVPAMGQIADAVSRRVHGQYEENPYPRWLAFDHQPPVDFAAWIMSELPGAGLADSIPDAPSVLVAGCGTGLEAISFAEKVAGARVTAVDLSLSSLVYAKRKAIELGLSNIEFFQAGILELSELPDRFDVILSAGVLHHMREPREGLRVLARLARPGGLIRVALYSQHARSGVNAMRDAIRKRKLPPADASIRAIRQEVLAAGLNSPLSGLLRWRDFFTMSECRDLLFHVQENQYTLPQIAEMLEAEDLAVLGLSKPLPRESVYAYWQMAPDDAGMADLKIWDAVEAQLPGTFESMYRIWCRTRPALKPA
jgi:SAM-dependent methyltransferase